MSAARRLAVAASERPGSWRAALEAAVRDEFRGTPLVPPAGSPLLPPACAVPGCVRTGFTAPWGRFQARLCHGHADRWIVDGRPPDSAGWVAAQAALLVMAPTVACAVSACPRAAAKGGLCRAHDRRWRGQGKPPLEEFVRSAPQPRRVWSRICRAPDCEFPAGVLATPRSRPQRRQTPISALVSRIPAVREPLRGDRVRGAPQRHDRDHDPDHRDDDQDVPGLADRAPPAVHRRCPALIRELPLPRARPGHARQRQRRWHDAAVEPGGDQPPHIVKGHRNGVGAVAFALDGRTLASAGEQFAGMEADRPADSRDVPWL